MMKPHLWEVVDFIIILELFFIRIYQLNIHKDHKKMHLIRFLHAMNVYSHMDAQ